jgi:hypothetical protein
MIRIISSIYDWLTLRDYHAAKEQATNDVVERLSRGNTLAQNGSSMEQHELNELSIAADMAMDKVERRLQK